MNGNLELIFRRSSFSNGAGECIEIASRPGGEKFVRDSKDETGPVLSFGAAEWSAFVAGVKGVEFDN